MSFGNKMNDLNKFLLLFDINPRFYNINNTNLNVVRAICYESFCSNKSLTIKINEDYFVCPRAGGKIEV